MKVVIMRGLPGSGKTTWHKTNYPNAEVFSADNFFTVSGEYRYDPTRIGEAHGACLRGFVEELVSGFAETIVVDNTNTTNVELAPYVRLCEAYGVEYEIVLVVCSWEVAARRNVHGVPAETVLRMYQRLIGEQCLWKQRVVIPQP